jgi:hypothetical protein
MIKTITSAGFKLSKQEQKQINGGAIGCQCGWCIRVRPFFDDSDAFRTCGTCPTDYRKYCQLP